jgi:ATP-dependent DNA ligase
LPAGTLVDGELVAFDADSHPYVARLLRRHGLTAAWRIGQARHWCPLRHVLFDLLYCGGRCLLREPLMRRREVLDEMCQRFDVDGMRFSEGMVA